VLGKHSGTDIHDQHSAFETLASVSYTSKLRKSSVLKDGPPEIEKWMAKNRMKKMRERLDRSGKTTGSAS